MIDVCNPEYATNPDGKRLVAVMGEGIITVNGESNSVGGLTSGKLFYIDCSPNPLFPKATMGDMYLVTESGKIGGSNGRPVTKGDILICIAPEVDEGEYMERADSWTVIAKDNKTEIGPDPDDPNNPEPPDDDGGISVFDPETGNWINSGIKPSDEDIDFDNPSDKELPTEKAVVDAIKKVSNEITTKMLKEMSEAIMKATTGVTRLLVIDCTEGGNVTYPIPVGAILHTMAIGIIEPYNEEAILEIKAGDQLVQKFVAGDYILSKPGITLLEPVNIVTKSESITAFYANYQCGQCYIFIGMSERPIKNS